MEEVIVLDEGTRGRGMSGERMGCSSNATMVMTFFKVAPTEAVNYPSFELSCQTVDHCCCCRTVYVQVY